MNRVALIAIAALALAVAGCGTATTSKSAFTTTATTICLRNVAPLVRKAPLGSSALLPTTEAQRAATAGCACIICTVPRGWLDPAHLIPASDSGGIDFLPRPEPVSRAQLAKVVTQVGLSGAMRRITGPSGLAGFTAPLTLTPTIEYLP
jgi:hypothetical protein